MDRERNMTREELENMREFQVGKASTEYYNAHPKADPIDAFEAGIEWSEKHPSKELIRKIANLLPLETKHISDDIEWIYRILNK